MHSVPLQPSNFATVSLKHAKMCSNLHTNIYLCIIYAFVDGEYAAGDRLLHYMYPTPFEEVGSPGSSRSACHEITATFFFLPTTHANQTLLLCSCSTFSVLLYNDMS